MQDQVLTNKQNQQLPTAQNKIGYIWSSYDSQMQKIKNSVLIYLIILVISAAIYIQIMGIEILRSLLGLLSLGIIINGLHQKRVLSKPNHYLQKIMFLSLIWMGIFLLLQIKYIIFPWICIAIPCILDFKSWGQRILFAFTFIYGGIIIISIDEIYTLIDIKYLLGPVFFVAIINIVMQVYQIITILINKKQSKDFKEAVFSSNFDMHLGMFSMLLSLQQLLSFKYIPEVDQIITYVILGICFLDLLIKAIFHRQLCFYRSKQSNSFHQDFYYLVAQNQMSKQCPQHTQTLLLQDKCLICFAVNSNVVLLPCLHFCICHHCIEYKVKFLDFDCLICKQKQFKSYDKLERKTISFFLELPIQSYQQNKYASGEVIDIHNLLNQK